jgi:xanthine permease XanP
MAKKPANLIYGVEEDPPLGTTLLQGIQHIFIMTVYFIFPVIIIKAVGGTDAQAATMIKMSMIGMGVTTIIQAVSKGPWAPATSVPRVTGPLTCRRPSWPPRPGAYLWSAA